MLVAALDLKVMQAKLRRVDVPLVLLVLFDPLPRGNPSRAFGQPFPLLHPINYREPFRHCASTAPMQGCACIPVDMHVFLHAEPL